MFPGGRGMNPKQMKAMMKRQGIEMDTMDDVEEVIIRTREKDLLIRRPEVTTITAQGTVTYQVVGRAEERARATGEGTPTEGADVAVGPPALYSDEDVRLVMSQTGASEEKARAALDASDGEVAEAIIKLIS